MKLTLILLTMLPLAGCDFGATVSHATATLGIDEPAAFALTEYPVPSSIEPVASSSAAPDCTPTMFRAVWTNPCTGETWDQP